MISWRVHSPRMASGEKPPLQRLRLMVRLRGRLAESYTVAISIALSLPLKKCTLLAICHRLT
jgi:hypothetical protein